MAAASARAWGSDFVKLHGAGHINVDSGHGDWPLGWGLLQGLLSECGAAGLPDAPNAEALTA